MPTELGEPFAITWRGIPEQMLPADVPLWHQFLDKHAREYERFYYNVKIGGPDVSNIKGDPQMIKMWRQVTAKRIDVLAEKKDSLEIIEVTTIPGLRAVGQCLSYLFLWNKDPKINKPAKMVLLTNRIDFDLEWILKAYQVEIIKIEPPK